MLSTSVAHPTHASCYLIRLTYPLSLLLPKKRENLMSERCSQTKTRNEIRLMRFSSGKQWECPCSRRVLIQTTFSLIFQGCTASEKNQRQCQKLEQSLLQKNKGPNKKKCLTVWTACERRCQDDGWVLAHCRCVFKDPGSRHRPRHRPKWNFWHRSRGIYSFESAGARNREQGGTPSS